MPIGVLSSYALAEQLQIYIKLVRNKQSDRIF